MYISSRVQVSHASGCQFRPQLRFTHIHRHTCTHTQTECVNYLMESNHFSPFCAAITKCPRLANLRKGEVYFLIVLEVENFEFNPVESGFL